MSEAALEGIRVLELSERRSAAFAGRWFVDLGAEVSRLVSPTASPGPVDQYLARGKAPLALDLRSASGPADLRNMIGEFDIFLSDLEPPEVDRLQIEAQGTGGPGVLALITPFGLSGPYRDYPSTPATLLAMSGHTFMMGDPWRAPLTLAGDYVAYQCGLVAFSAALSALIDARRSGRTATSTVEICELEVLTSLHQYTTVMWSYAKRIRRRAGNQYDGSYPLTILPCADGWFGICIVASFWDAFARWLNPAWLDDPRFDGQPARSAHADELDAAITKAIAGRRKHDLEREGQLGVRVPVGAVNTLDEILRDPHLSARAFWDTTTIDGQERLVPGLPFRFLGEGVSRAAAMGAVGERAERPQ